jgi:catechol 2,3-dioxygenase-like lactoylglutathione lyase family enzyme
MKLEPQKDHAIDHIAFSYRDIEPVFGRMKKAGVTIAEPIAEREEFGIKSFFVLGPDGLLIEIVEAKPVPEGIWD